MLGWILNQLKTEPEHKGGGGGGKVRIKFGNTGPRGRLYAKAATTSGSPVIVKNKFIANTSHSKSAIRNHVTYLSDRERGVDEPVRKFFTSDRNDLSKEEAIDLMIANQGKRTAIHTIILSPGTNDIDLVEYARDSISRLEERLGHKLTWVGTTHQNTEHFHVHVDIAGKIPESDRDEIIRRAREEQSNNEIEREKVNGRCSESPNGSDKNSVDKDFSKLEYELAHLDESDFQNGDWLYVFEERERVAAEADAKAPGISTQHDDKEFDLDGLLDERDLSESRVTELDKQEPSEHDESISQSDTNTRDLLHGIQENNRDQVKLERVLDRYEKQRSIALLARARGDVYLDRSDLKELRNAGADYVHQNRSLERQLSQAIEHELEDLRVPHDRHLRSGDGKELNFFEAPWREITRAFNQPANASAHEENNVKNTSKNAPPRVNPRDKDQDDDERIK